MHVRTGVFQCARDGPDMIETQIDLASVARRCQEGRSGKDVVRIKLSTDAGAVVYFCFGGVRCSTHG